MQFSDVITKLPESAEKGATGVLSGWRIGSWDVEVLHHRQLGRHVFWRFRLGRNTPFYEEGGCLEAHSIIPQGTIVVVEYVSLGENARIKVFGGPH